MKEIAEEALRLHTKASEPHDRACLESRSDLCVCDRSEARDEFYSFVNKNLASLATAYLESLKQAEWQPIDSAPKDGTAVLCFIPLPTMSDQSNSRILVMRWNDGAGWRTDVHPLQAFEPTHWMHLPAAPIPKGGTGQ